MVHEMAASEIESSGTSPMEWDSHYDHVQKAPLGLLLRFAALCFVLVGVASREPGLLWVTIAIAMVTTAVSMMFGYLRIRDEGRHLAIRYGPWKVFSKRINYEEITQVEPNRSSLIDGWGIHYVPFRGWTYNLWGFDCAKLTVDNKTFRLGTDDVANLVDLVQSKIGQANTE